MARILVCDDADDLRALMAIALRADGHEPVPVAGGRKALRVLLADPDLDAAVLDLQMPEVDGWAVLESLRRSAARDHVGVVVCSVKSDDADHRRALSLGCDGYVAKPFDLAELQRQVREALERTPAEREAWRRARLLELDARALPSA